MASSTVAAFLLGALRLHQRDHLARDDRERHEGGREHDAGEREDPWSAAEPEVAGLVLPEHAAITCELRIITDLMTRRIDLI